MNGGRWLVDRWTLVVGAMLVSKLVGRLVEGERLVVCELLSGLLGNCQWFCEMLFKLFVN